LVQNNTWNTTYVARDVADDMIYIYLWANTGIVGAQCQAKFYFAWVKDGDVTPWDLEEGEIASFKNAKYLKF
jgi:hypothetical protein